MRVLWHSQPPWMPYGFGQQTALFVRRLRDLGHDIAVSAAVGLIGGVIEWEGVPVYPGDQAGYASLSRNARLFSPEVVVTLLDVSWAGILPARLDVPFASFAPIEHDPLPTQTHVFFEATEAHPWALTRNGEHLLRDAGFSADYVPHGIDLNIFKPQDRTEARAQLGLPQSAFIVGMVAANRPDGGRKSFPEAFEAFARFRSTHPDALLAVHSSRRGGTDLMRLADQLGISDALVMSDEDRMHSGLISPEAMAQTYAAFNVLLAPSHGEGFCLPLLEAQACGVPVIVSDFGAMTEVGAVGWHVKGERQYVPDKGAWWLAPDVNEIMHALDQAYYAADSLSATARKHASTYDVDTITEQYLVPALDRLSSRSESPAPQQRSGSSAAVR